MHEDRARCAMSGHGFGAAHNFLPFISRKLQLIQILGDWHKIRLMPNVSFRSNAASDLVQ
jgi:hypothetical protein